MSTVDPTNQTTETEPVKEGDFRLEVVVVPVSDVDHNDLVKNILNAIKHSRPQNLIVHQCIGTVVGRRCNQDPKLRVKFFGVVPYQVYSAPSQPS